MSGEGGREPEFEILEIVGVEEPESQARRHAPAGPAAAPHTGPQPIRRPPVAEAELARHAAARMLLREMLPSLEALENCIRQRPDQERLEQGVRIALRGLLAVFRAHKLERIDGDGMPFDPRFHEAAEITPSARVPVNTVLETLRPGYMLGGELVRPALVRVSVEERPAGPARNGR